MVGKLAIRNGRGTSFTALSYDREMLNHSPIYNSKAKTKIPPDRALLDLPERLLHAIKLIEGNKKLIDRSVFQSQGDGDNKDK